jgi:glycosyltransferase involved in cell wall biosynthesis
LFARHLERLLLEIPAESRDKILLRFDFGEEDKRHLMSLLDALAYPSRYESFGLTFLEAWAAGKPVIGCRCGAVAEVVHDGVDGLLVPYGDPATLAEAILALLANPDRARELGEAGRRRVRAHHRWRTIAARFRDAYVRTIARRC